MLTVTIGGSLLGEIYLDRTSAEPQTLSLTLASADRRYREFPTAAGSADPPLLQDLGKGVAEVNFRTQQRFDSIDDAAWRLLELADLRGFAGEVIFETIEGRRKSFDYGIAQVTGTESIGALLRVDWQLKIGRRFVC